MMVLGRVCDSVLSLLLVTTLEAFTILAESSFVPKIPLEFHWYSAEEAGLLGSQDIAAQYKKDHRVVRSMVQNDMTGYHPDGIEHIGLISDFTDPELFDYYTMLVDEYCDIPWVQTKCGYACSDHASFHKQGYVAMFNIEGLFSESSPYIHSANDLPEYVDVNHMAQFTKLVLGYAVELTSDV